MTVQGQPLVFGSLARCVIGCEYDLNFMLACRLLGQSDHQPLNAFVGLLRRLLFRRFDGELCVGGLDDLPGHASVGHFQDRSSAVVRQLECCRAGHAPSDVVRLGLSVLLVVCRMCNLGGD